MDDKIDQKIDEVIEKKIEEKMASEELYEASELEKIIEEKLSQRVDNQFITNRMPERKNDSGGYSRRDFLKLIGMGVGGLALSGAASGVSWSVLRPSSSGVSDIRSSSVADNAITSAKIKDGAIQTTDVSFQPRTDVSEGGTTTVSNVSDINFTRAVDVTDDADGTVSVNIDFSDPTAIDFPFYSQLSDVPSLNEGDVVYVSSENDLYVEDGT